MLRAHYHTEVEGVRDAFALDDPLQWKLEALTGPIAWNAGNDDDMIRSVPR